MLRPGQREIWSRNAVVVYFWRILDAVRAGTFDLQPDRHFSWDAIILDRRAWQEVTDRLDDTLGWLDQVRAESECRLQESGEEPIATTVGMSAFLSPTPVQPRRGGH